MRIASLQILMRTDQVGQFLSIVHGSRVFFVRFVNCQAICTLYTVHYVDSIGHMTRCYRQRNLSIITNLLQCIFPIAFHSIV